MTEGERQRAILGHCCKGPVRLFRNNIAKLQVRGQWLSFGIPGPGGGDLIGWRSMVITPEHVGRTVAVFASIEVKAEGGRTTPDQARWSQIVQNAGGIAGTATTPNEAESIIHGY